MTEPKAALDRAEEAISGAVAPERLLPPTRRVAVGDPQAPASKFFAILEAHGLLSASGWLEADVRLVSIGDHFDFGAFEVREEAGRDGMRILSWLAAHAPEQVTLIAGNHDLSRVAELMCVDDTTFALAAQEAHALYTQPVLDEQEHEAFLRRYPWCPAVEVAARDLSTFRVEQRELVTRLLRRKRFRFAAATGSVLLVHAGATRDDLERAGLEPGAPASAEKAAVALNACFDAAIDAWDGRSPFSVPGFFVAGSAADGEPGGFLFQRPARLDRDDLVPAKDKKRRFDPRRLPLGLIQAVGHVRDNKCRALLGDWVTDEAASEEGQLRSLWTDGTSVRYSRGVDNARAPGHRASAMLFIDGGMNHAAVEHYELLELAADLQHA